MRAALIFALLLRSPAAEADFIVWNVGQGLWTTRVHESRCEHFDLGGEFAPWKMIRERCEKKENHAHFSHWDWDHIGFSKQAFRRLNAMCIATTPGGRAVPAKKRMMENFENCELPAREITFRRNQTDSNGASRVFLSEKILIPGDSGVKEEKFWSRDSRLRQVETLVLGHHGSKTSTSNLLLKRMPNLRQAIASARHKKYGHPHEIILKRLRSRGIAVLKTEEWGSIVIKRERSK